MVPVCWLGYIVPLMPSGALGAQSMGRLTFGSEGKKGWQNASTFPKQGEKERKWRVGCVKVVIQEWGEKRGRKAKRQLSFYLCHGQCRVGICGINCCMNERKSQGLACHIVRSAVSIAVKVQYWLNKKKKSDKLIPVLETFVFGRKLGFVFNPYIEEASIWMKNFLTGEGSSSSIIEEKNA